MDKTDILVLVPMKDIHGAKSRLRKSFSKELQPTISSIVKKLFLNTISSLKAINVSYSVVSPSEDILDIALDYNSSFIYQDDGLDLNIALTTAISYAFHLKKWKYILILTADLLYLNIDSLEQLFSFFSGNKVTIIPAPEKSGIKGTSGLFFPLTLWKNNLRMVFGYNSYNKFIGTFKQNNIIWNSYNDTLGIDLDDIDDLTRFYESNNGKKVIEEINEVMTLQ